MRSLVAELPPLERARQQRRHFQGPALRELHGGGFPAHLRDQHDRDLHASHRRRSQRCATGGRIVNIASRAYLGAKNQLDYVASKGAVVSFTRALAMEVIKRGILVNAVAPGLIDTPILRGLSPERLQAQLALQPTGKAGTAGGHRERGVVPRVAADRLHHRPGAVRRRRKVARRIGGLEPSTSGIRCMSDDEWRIVTGAGSGIGRATTLRLVRAGVAVLGVDLSRAGLDETRSLAADRRARRYPSRRCHGGGRAGPIGRPRRRGFRRPRLPRQQCGNRSSKGRARYH